MHNSHQFLLYGGRTPADQGGYLRGGQSGGKTKRQQFLLLRTQLGHGQMHLG